MSRARQILCGQFYMLTRRCTQRQFLLRPDEETNNSFVYCLGEAAIRFGIVVVLPTAESNHHHTVVFDPHGNLPAFLEHFHKMVARCMNARWGRWENFWSSSEPTITRLLDRDAVIKKLVYAASNPVKDLLVQYAHQWPGANGYVHLLRNTPMIANRPRHFFRDNGTMPETITLTLEIPAALGDRTQVIEEVRAGVQAVEREMLAHRAATGARILGVRGALKQSWSGAPTTPAPLRTLRPRFAGGSHVRIAALIAYKAFLASYAHARRLWQLGKPTVFPVGTYWLARHAPIELVTPTAI